MMSSANEPFWRVATAIGCIALWMPLTATVVMFNKYLLTYAGFPYAVAITMWHMAFCSVLAFLLVRLNFVKALDMDFVTYTRTAVPIGACFAGALWLSNASYVLLSVSFVQMLKAGMPVLVFVCGCFMGTDSFNLSRLIVVVLITVGVAISACGEIDFVWAGVLMQGASMVLEAVRLILVQVLLQSKGLKLNPVTTLYYVAPCCFLFLTIPFTLLEAPKLLETGTRFLTPTFLGMFLANGTAAFALNMSVFLLLGKTSALTMNVAGIVKDWGLIALSYLWFRSPVTVVNLLGYCLAFTGVLTYNWQKLSAMRNASAELVRPADPWLAGGKDAEKGGANVDASQPLLAHEGGGRPVTHRYSPPGHGNKS